MLGLLEVDLKVAMSHPDSGEAKGQTEPEMEAGDEELYVQLPLVGTAILPMTLKAVLELGVAEILVKGCAAQSKDAEPVMMTAHEVALQLPTKNPQAADILDRMLALLASFNIVRCSVETKDKEVRRYGPAPIFRGLSTSLLVPLMMEETFITTGHYLKDVVIDGGTAFEKAHGMIAYEYMDTNPRFSRIFNEAMKNYSAFTVNKMLETYQGFKNINVLVDVGGGIGAALDMIISKYPHIKGINLDLPHAISKALPLPGVDHVGGDMFEHIPHGDAIFLKWILHNWIDEKCLKILRNCYMALPNKGKIIIVDHILPVKPNSTTKSKGAFIFDVMMLLHHDGKERTKSEFEILATEAGFTHVETTNLWGEMGIIELTK